MFGGDGHRVTGQKDEGDFACWPCVSHGIVIATPRGERLIHDLHPGDRVITRDNGIQTIRDTLVRTLGLTALRRAPHLRPILIQRGALGQGLPERDMRISPNQRLLVNGTQSALHLDAPEALVAAKHLLGLPGVVECPLTDFCFVHLKLDRHEVLLANGCWTECFQPEDQSVRGTGNAQRIELLELFPVLRQVRQIQVDTPPGTAFSLPVATPPTG